jgi:hypothetical protein
LLKKWYLYEAEYNTEKMGELINRFWQEFEEFQTKTDPYANREYIFRNHIDLNNGKLHFWHKKETLLFLVDLLVKFVRKYLVLVPQNVCGGMLSI